LDSFGLGEHVVQNERQLSGARDFNDTGGLLSVNQFHRGAAYVSSGQRFLGYVFQFAFEFGCVQLARDFFNSSISLWGMARCTLAPWVKIICSQEQKNSTDNNSFMGPVICGGRFFFRGVSHHAFWIDKNERRGKEWLWHPQNDVPSSVPGVGAGDLNIEVVVPRAYSTTTTTV
jgi:hypothetical protein